MHHRGQIILCTCAVLGFASFDRASCCYSQEAEFAQAPKGLRRLGFREKEEFSKLEQEIDALTADKDDLHAKITATASTGDFVKANELSTELRMLGDKLEAKTERWLELAERAEAMGTV